jgi:hypothetical protein
MQAAIDPVYVLNKLGLTPGMSVSRAITKVGMDISESSDQLQAANKIISSLGSKPVANTIAANIIAKALIEQAVIFGEQYTPTVATEIAAAKLKKIEKTMPYVFAGTDEAKPDAQGNVSRPRKAAPVVNDKKERARVIFEREKGKELGTIAKLIAVELEITYANAYYYVSRVFK